MVPTLAVQAATTTAADATVVAGFEIDGDTPVNEGGVDWAGLPDATTHKSDPVGNADTSTFKGKAPTDCRHTVSGTISLPARGTFHLSLTVLVRYRSSRSI